MISVNECSVLYFVEVIGMKQLLKDWDYGSNLLINEIGELFERVRCSDVDRILYFIELCLCVSLADLK